MSKRIKVADLPEFDSAQYLDSDEAIAAYLTDILEANDAALLAFALDKIARARGMTAKQIEYWARIGKAVLENPELPLRFIQDTMLSLEEVKAGRVTPYK